MARENARERAHGRTSAGESTRACLQTVTDRARRKHKRRKYTDVCKRYYECVRDDSSRLTKDVDNMYSGACFNLYSLIAIYRK